VENSDRVQQLAYHLAIQNAASPEYGTRRPFPASEDARRLRAKFMRGVHGRRELLEVSDVRLRSVRRPAIIFPVARVGEQGIAKILHNKAR